MDIDTFEPVPITNMGGLTTQVAASDVPKGCSPDCRDVQFFPGSVRTRPGQLNAQNLGPVPVPYVKTYITPDLSPRLLMYGADGKLWKETGTGTKTLISSTFQTSELLQSVTAFGKEWIAASTGLKGLDLPSVYDDANLYLIGNRAPLGAPKAADSGTGTVLPPPIPTAALAGDGAAGLSVGAYLYKYTYIFEYVFGSGAETDGSVASVPVSVVSPSTDGKIKLTAFPVPPLGMSIGIYRTIANGAVFKRVSIINPSDYPNGFTDSTPDGALGQDIPSTNLTTSGNLVKGKRQVVVFFESASGYLSKPSAPATWDAAGGAKVLVTNIPIWNNAAIGERPVVARRLAFTAADGATFYYISGKMRIADNTTTQLEVDFTDTELVNGEDVSRLFRAVVPQAKTDFLGQLGVGFYARRIVFWGGNPDVGQPFRSSLARWSRADEPEFFDGVEGFMEVSENDGQGIRAGFELFDRWYFVKEHSVHSTQDDGINEPDKWSVKRESHTVGTPSVQGVGLGEDWAVIANRAGLYYFGGNEFIKISQEIQPTWDSLNWEFAHLMWVRVDVEKKRIYIGCPMCNSSTNNVVLVCDYQEGILVNPLDNGGRGRKWCPWFMRAASMDVAQKDTQESRVTIGTSDGSGNVNEIRNSALTDAGTFINSYYRTAYIEREEVGRQLFGYQSFNINGQGVLNLKVYRSGAAVINLQSLNLIHPGTKDMERRMDVQTERASFFFGVNGDSNWFSLSKVVIWAKSHPWSKFRQS